MELLREILRETPVWVYLLFSLLILLSFRSIRSRSLSIRQLFIFPLACTILNLFWLSERIHIHIFFLFFWLLGIGIGTFFGWVMVRFWKITIIRHQEKITLPPTWSSLFLVLLFFGIRYFFVYNYKVHPEAASHLFLADSLTSGAMTGIFIGRTIQLLQKYQKELDGSP